MNSVPSLGEKLNQFQLDQIWHSDLLEMLCNPERFEAQVAINLARQLLEQYPDCDTRLVRELMDLPDVGAGKDPRVERCLEIVDAVSSGRRIIMPLLRLMNSKNRRIRSKVARVLGRRVENGTWSRRLIGEVDPRTRANIIEGLWGNDSPEIREMLWLAAEDGNNRVRGNAILGLYRLGVVSVLPVIRRLAENQTANYRATAAWLMGASADPRFRATIKKLREDPAASVRSAALRALVQLNKNEGTKPSIDQGPPELFFDDLDGIRRVWFELPKGSNNSRVMLATDVVLTEGGELVWDYALLERRLNPVAALFLLLETGSATLGGLKEAFLHCLDQKNPSDRWTIARVSSGSDGNFTDPRSILPPYQGPELKKAIGRFDELPRVSSVQLSKLVRLVGNAGPGRHVILFVTPSSLSDEDLDSVEVAAAALQFSVDIVSFQDSGNERLQKLAHKTNGIIVCPPEEGVSPAWMASVYATIGHRYEITYSPSGSGSPEPEVAILPPRGENTA